MRPNVYGGYCAFENNLPNSTNAFKNLSRPTIQIINQHSTFSRQQYTPLQPKVAAHIHHAQQQHPLGFNNSIHNAKSGHNITPTQQQANQQIFLPKPPPSIAQHALRTRPSNYTSAVQFQHAPAFNIVSQNPSLRQPPPPPPLPPSQLVRPLSVELTNAHNYAKQSTSEAFNQQRIRECAGLPLISNAYTQRQRMQQRKTNTVGPIMNQSARDICFSNFHPNYNWTHSGISNVQNEHNNLARLAAHTQGAPLLLQKVSQMPPYWPNTMRSSINNPSTIDKSRLCYQYSAPPVLSTQNKENFAKKTSEMDSNVPTSSPLINTDVAKDSNKTCLPRIIKPRKRRKKDRKPANGVFLKLDVELESKTASFTPETSYTTRPTNLYEEVLPKYNNTTSDALKTLEKYPLPNKCKAPCALEIHQYEGNCYCNSCNTLRSIWEYPLRRSFSDASNSSTNEMCSKNDFCSSPILSISSTSSLSSSSSPTNSGAESITSSVSLASTSFLKTKADSEAFSPITTDSTRANIVGIIGSNRVNNHENYKAFTANSMTCNYEHPNAKHTTMRDAATCLSDSNDSNYGDILSGINIADDLFKHVKTNEPESHTLTPSRSLLLPYSAAETLLTASINEISRQLIETCINESTISTTSTQQTSTTAPTNELGYCRTFSNCSDISNDSGLDSAGSLQNCDEVIFKFDDLSLNEKAHVQSDMVDTQCDLILPNLNLYLDFNNNLMDNGKNFQLLDGLKSGNLSLNDILIDQKDQHDQQFVQNCCDTVWRDLSISNVMGDLVSKSVY